MYQAIVFLPLLGAILAGLIAIFGAHARHPSGDSVEHHGDDGAAPMHRPHMMTTPMTITAMTTTPSPSRRRRVRARPN